MVFPEWCKDNSTIGITACSDGASSPMDLLRLQFAEEEFRQKGFQTVITPDVKTSIKGRSAEAEIRAKELLSLVKMDQVKAVFQLRGGDYLLEILPFLDFALLKEYPKWYQGYSDASGLLFPITTMLDIATVYGSNFLEFSMQKWHRSMKLNLEFLRGNLEKQESFDLYQDGFTEHVTGREEYRLTKNVSYRCRQDNITLKGRMLGGCLDVLLDLCGTRFDKVKMFCDKYNNDRILWYLESFNLPRERLTIGLWRLMEAGWFRNASGFIFGRPAFFEGSFEEYQDAVEASLKKLSLPVVYETDLGHKPPRFTIVNGAMSEFTLSNQKGVLKQNFTI